MTESEALDRARTLFNESYGKGPQSHRFTGEARVVDLARAIAEEERLKGFLWPGITPEQRQRAGDFYRVIFLSALPQIDRGSRNVSYRVDKTSGELTEEMWD